MISWQPPKSFSAMFSHNEDSHWPVLPLNNATGIWALMEFLGSFFFLSARPLLNYISNQFCPDNPSLSVSFSSMPSGRGEIQKRVQLELK
uniref:Uncharacterized protein n=1 Tax=Anguilla anguilla TaxID=7936 RepID=A0A0E9WMV9_ANGAN